MLIIVEFCYIFMILVLFYHVKLTDKKWILISLVLFVNMDTLCKNSHI